MYQERLFRGAYGRGSKMTEWHEFKIIRKLKPNREDWDTESEKHWEISKFHLIPLVRKLKIEEFHFFNYFDSNIDSHIKFRFCGNEHVIERIRRHLEDLKTQGKVDSYELSEYDPKEDAKQRATEGAPRRLADQLPILKLGNWAVSPADPKQKTKELEAVLRKVVGKCTAAFYEDFDRKPKDMWLVSVFIHLLINSIGLSGNEEQSARQYPYV
jgi:hypothetical protein